MDEAELDRLLAVARDVTGEAAATLASVRPAEIRSKSSPRDLVTEWDTRCEDLVRARLAVRSADIPIVGEERGGEAVAGAAWLLDPIDGTVNFAHGLPLWGISLALVADGAPLLGVVQAPALGWSFWGRRGGGGWWRRGGEEGRLQVSGVARLDQALLVTGFPYDRATSAANNFAQWEHFQRRAGAVRRLGAASLDLCMVAAGWLDGYWERRLQPWDIAAGVVLVEEAGGRVTDPAGGPLDVRSGAVVASNGGIHQAMLDELAIADARAAAVEAR
jgi:myo-inositol-1(or 4)-monophosphatase